MTKKLPARNEDHIRQGSPVNATFAESIPRWGAAADLAIAATGVALAVGVPVQKGDLISNVSFLTGGTAAGTPTAGFAAVYDPSGNLLSQSADFGSTARAANSPFTVPLTTPVVALVSGLYYVSLSWTATTVPTLRGASAGHAVVTGNLGLSARVLSQSHGSALGGTAPTTIASGAAHASIPYVVLT